MSLLNFVARGVLIVLTMIAFSGCGETSSRIERSQDRLIDNALVGLSRDAAVNRFKRKHSRVIVKFRMDAEANDNELGRAAWVSRRLGAKIYHGRALGRRTQSMYSDEVSAAALLEALQAMPEVEWVVEDRQHRIRSLPNDPFFSPSEQIVSPVAAGQWFLRTPDKITPVAIDALRAWGREKGRPEVVVAVLDSGVLLSHPDLSGKLRPGYDFVSDLFSAADGSRRDSDPTDPGDATVAGECDPWEPAYESSWHGTQVAGLIGAATDNGIGVASAGRDISVLPVRVLGKCGGYDSDIIAGMLWAGGLTTNVGLGRTRTYPNSYPAKVINLSLGTQGICTKAYVDAIGQLTQQGVTVVAAAGNDTGFPVATPANCPGVIAVSGLRHIGTKVGYSNIGPEVTLAAPAGNCVNLIGPCLYPLVTTTNAGRSAPTINTYSDGENITVGTSFAAPLVAATVALMISVNRNLSPLDIKSILKRTARPFPRTGAEGEVIACKPPSSVEQLECYCTTTTCGAGFLNSFDAVSVAADLAASQSGYRPQVALYNPETNHLQMARVEVGGITYYNVSVEVGRLVSMGSRPAAIDGEARYDLSNGLLYLDEAAIGKERFQSLTLTIKEVLQVGVP